MQLYFIKNFQIFEINSFCLRIMFMCAHLLKLANLESYSLNDVKCYIRLFEDLFLLREKVGEHIYVCADVCIQYIHSRHVTYNVKSAA